MELRTAPLDAGPALGSVDVGQAGDDLEQPRALYTSIAAAHPS